MVAGRRRCGEPYVLFLLRARARRVSRERRASGKGVLPHKTRGVLAFLRRRARGQRSQGGAVGFLPKYLRSRSHKREVGPRIPRTQSHLADDFELIQRNTLVAKIVLDTKETLT